MIHHGKKVLDESLDAVRARFDPRTVLVEPLDRDADVRALEASAGVAAVHRADRGYTVALRPGADVSATMRAIVSACPPRHLELQRPTLEDVFVTLVGEAAE